MKTTPSAIVAASGNLAIDGILGGSKWDALTFTYAFPQDATSYGDPVAYSDAKEPQSFVPVSAALRAVVTTMVKNLAQFTNVTFTQETNAANFGTSTFRFASATSAVAVPTAQAYFPGASNSAGDEWFGPTAAYTNPQLGDYGWDTVFHEMGHALGLKHPHDTGGTYVVPANQDAMELSIMSYRSYAGGSVTGGYTNETGGFDQTFMQNDIAALQYMYGANFSGPKNNIYSFSSTTGEMSINGVGQGVPTDNRILRTIWDGGGHVTYDFSGYATNEMIDLNPGKASILSPVQLANLGNGNFAKGEIYNALQFGTDTRSLIANVKGGSGNDTIAGNAADNVINAGAGLNYVDGAGGVNTIDYSTSATKVYADIGANSAYHDTAQQDHLVNIQNVIGTNFGDRMYGTAGDNIFTLGTGQNIVYGQGGSDTVNYSKTSSLLYVDLDAFYVTHDGTIDYLTGISNVTGNNTSGDRFYGTAGNNIFTLGTGQNIVYGKGGSDTADYSAGSSQLYVDLGAFYATHDGTTDYLTGISNVTGNNTNGDRFYGTAGNNTFTLGTGQNIVYGQGGIDSVNYSHAATAIYADIYSAGGSGHATHDGTTDYLAGITNVTGSAQNDRIYGTRTGNATLDGGAGNDTIYAFGGGNSVFGGLGDDALVGLGNDTLTGGAGADRFYLQTPGVTADTLTDFSAAQGDHILVRELLFGSYMAGDAVSLVTGTTGAAMLAATTQGFGFDTGTGDLFFKASGTTSTVAHLTGVATLSATDIVVYGG